MFANAFFAKPARLRMQTLAMVCVFALAMGACGKRKSTRAPVTPVKPAKIGATETGEASWYGIPYHGRRGSSGEIFDMEKLTAAHRTLPFQTWVEVTNLANGKQVDVRITDRGPFVDGRIIDLSLAAAREIDMVRSGVARVRLRVIESPRITSQLDPAKPEPTPNILPPAAGPAPPSKAIGALAGEFAVQAGAFADRDRAMALGDSLRFPEVRVVPSNSNPPIWRVRIGNSLTLDAATKLAAEVQAVTGQAFVVPNR
ncbi:MAG: septal ring lytic transglycosylase RlpA family protein [Acidobacteriota bacterium]